MASTPNPPSRASLSTLPTELFLQIVSSTLTQRDLASLCLTNRRLNTTLFSILLKTNVSSHRASGVLWSASKRDLNVLSMFLSAGARLSTCNQKAGSEALCIAVSKIDIAMVAMLLDAGAVPFKKLWACIPFYIPATAEMQARVEMGNAIWDMVRSFGWNRDGFN